MDQDIKDYLKVVEKKILDKTMKASLYAKEGNTLKLLSNSNDRNDIKSALKIITDEGLTGTVAVFFYVFNFKTFFKGPLNIVCEIYDYVKGTRVKTNSVQVFYTIDELYSRGFKVGDYKKVYTKLMKGELLSIDSGKIFTVSSID